MSSVLKRKLEECQRDIVERSALITEIKHGMQITLEQMEKIKQVLDAQHELDIEDAIWSYRRISKFKFAKRIVMKPDFWTIYTENFMFISSSAIVRVEHKEATVCLLDKSEVTKDLISRVTLHNRPIAPILFMSFTEELASFIACFSNRFSEIGTKYFKVLDDYDKFNLRALKHNVIIVLWERQSIQLPMEILVGILKRALEIKA